MNTIIALTMFTVTGLLCSTIGVRRGFPLWKIALIGAAAGGTVGGLLASVGIVVGH